MSLRGSFGLLSQDGLPEAAIVVSSVAKHIALLGCRIDMDAHTRMGVNAWLATAIVASLSGNFSLR